MALKRILIFSARSLFGQGIKNLLDAEPECEVIGWETDAEEAVKHIQELQPDVVLVVNKCPSDSLISDGQRFLRAGGEAKIIELNLEDRNGCAYVSKCFAIQEVGDLLKAIEEPVNVVPKKAGHSTRTREPKERSKY